MNPATHQRICAEIQERHQREMSKVVAQRDELAAALENLAKLGNEPHYGNSIGNQIAQDALAKVGAGETARPPTMPDWAACESRGPFVRNSLKHWVEELRRAAAKARKAYRHEFMAAPFTYIADAYDEAADVLQLQLDAVTPSNDNVTGPAPGEETTKKWFGRRLCRIGLHRKSYPAHVVGWDCKRCGTMQTWRRGQGPGWCD